MKPAIRISDPQVLRALAHPLRNRLLARLRLDGPATASRLAEQLDESRGATSYHLRQLEHYGFVAEVEGRGTARERWWQALHQQTSWEPDELAAQPGEQDVAPLGGPDGHCAHGCSERGNAAVKTLTGRAPGRSSRTVSDHRSSTA